MRKKDDLDKKFVSLLISGGVDSTALINYYLALDYEVHGLFVSYGQASNQWEQRAVHKVIDYYQIPCHTVKVCSSKNFKGGEILGRNLMLVSTALINFPRESGTIAIGIHSGTSYNDCTSEFVSAVQGTFDLYRDGLIKLEAPLIEMEKRSIWEYCITKKVPLELTYSCENGVELGCKNCLSCLDQKLLNEFS